MFKVFNEFGIYISVFIVSIILFVEYSCAIVKPDIKFLLKL